MKRHEVTKKASILGINANLLLLILKGTIGFLSNSQSMIADSLNSFGDVLSSVMAYVGNKISSKEADEDHHMGHGKAEYIFSFLISIVMIVTSLTMIKNAILTYWNQVPITFSWFLVFACCVTIVTKFCLYLYTKILNRKQKNILIEAMYKDHRNDCFITSFTLLSAILGMYEFVLLDIVVGILIGLWIGYTSLKLFIKSYDVLMDKAMDENTKDKVYDIIHRHKEILRVNHFNTTPVGYRYQISFTIFVDGNLTTFESHDIANTLEREIEREIPEIYLTVIHVNPTEVKKKSKKEKI